MSSGVVGEVPEGGGRGADPARLRPGALPPSLEAQVTGKAPDQRGLVAPAASLRPRMEDALGVEGAGSRVEPVRGSPYPTLPGARHWWRGRQSLPGSPQGDRISLSPQHISCCSLSPSVVSPTGRSGCSLWSDTSITARSTCASTATWGSTGR